MIPIRDDVFARMGELSPSEKKVARALLANYPSAGLASAATLAKAAGTSTPTVLRLVSRLGIASYPAFQQQLRDELTDLMNSPLSRAELSLAVAEDSSVMNRAIGRRIELVEVLGSTVPPDEFEKAVAVLSAAPKHVVVSGGYFSRLLAQLMTMQLDQLIANVDFATEPLGFDMGKYLRLSKDSVAIIFDMRRYELTAKEVAMLAKSKGATVILITDEGLSPACEEADVVLPVRVAGAPFDSFAGLLVLIESLVDAVFTELGAKGLSRLKDWEESVHIVRTIRSSVRTHEADERAELDDQDTDDAEIEHLQTETLADPAEKG